MNYLVRVGAVLAILLVFVGASLFPSITGEDSLTVCRDQRIGMDSALKVVATKLRECGQADAFRITYTIGIQDKDTDHVLFYVVHLHPQGYIIVSGCYDLPPIIAYSFTNNFQRDRPKNILLEMLKADLHSRLTNVPNMPADHIEQRHQTWEMYLNGKHVGDKDFQQWPPAGSTVTGGWLETNWHQSAPYNNFCPLDIVHGSRSVAGCPAVAMAQIMNYHETTNAIVFNDTDDYYHNYNGNRYWIDDDHDLYDFPSFPEMNSYLDNVVSHYQTQTPLTNDDKAAFMFACGVAAQQVYGSGGSGTFGVNQAYDAYLRFNCTTVDLLDEDDAILYENLAMNMIEGYPAHLAIVNPQWTIGHNLVVDGYNTNHYYHLNFGWGGGSNGWYLLPDELPYGLTVIEGVIVNIMMNHSSSHCGDANNDGIINVGDVVYLVNYLYRNGPAPSPLSCFGDVTGDGKVDVGDVVYLVNYLYRNGPAPSGCC